MPSKFDGQNSCLRFEFCRTSKKFQLKVTSHFNLKVVPTGTLKIKDWSLQVFSLYFHSCIFRQPVPTCWSSVQDSRSSCRVMRPHWLTRRLDYRHRCPVQSGWYEAKASCWWRLSGGVCHWDGRELDLKSIQFTEDRRRRQRHHLFVSDKRDCAAVCREIAKRMSSSARFSVDENVDFTSRSIRTGSTKRVQNCGEFLLHLIPI